MATRKEKETAALQIAVIELVRHKGEILEASLYLLLEKRLGADGYEQLVVAITKSGLVQKRGHTLRWIGPDLHLVERKEKA